MNESKLKRESKVMNIFMSIIPPVAFLLILLGGWEAYCRINEVPVWKLPKPADIFSAFFTGFGETLPYLASTYFNIIVGFILAVVIGLAVALILSNSRILSMALTPIIVVFCCVPMVTLVPLLLVTMGTGAAPKILTVVIQCFPIINMNACVGFSNVDRTRMELMQSMKASKVQMYRYCMFRDAMPDIFTGIKLASVLAMIAGVSAEICGGSGGLGNNISSLIGLNRTPEAFSCLIYVIILGMLLYGIIGLLEKKMTKGM